MFSSTAVAITAAASATGELATRTTHAATRSVLYNVNSTESAVR